VADLVPAADIERIVGAVRDERQHLGRAVSAELTVYVLHSQQCRELHEAGARDVRECLFSLALDRGIDPADWAGMEDRPVVLRARGGRLVPARPVLQRLQLRRTKDWRLPDGAIVVARPGRWGNPHRLQGTNLVIESNGLEHRCQPGDARGVAVRLYREDLVNGRLPYGVEDVERELAGHDLACWCKPGDPCHADVLLDLANRNDRA